MNTRLFLLIVGSAFSFAAAASSYTLDPRQTFPSLHITQLGMAIPLGRFNQTSGTMQLDLNAATGRIQLSINSASISTGIASLETHLRSPALLDAEHYPTITFVSDKLSFNKQQVVAADGHLTLHGITKPVHVEVQDFHCGPNPVTLKHTCDANATLHINRSDFGIANYVPVIADQTQIAVRLSAIQD